MRSLLLLFAACGVLAAQVPHIAYRGIYNAASYMAEGLPGGAIARGSAFSLFGTHLGPSETPPLAFPLETNLGGVTITVTQGDTTVNAIPITLSPGQINAILPSDAPLGMATVRVRYKGPSNPLPVRIVDASFGIFTANSAGNGPGIIQNTTDASLPINSLQTPAKPGATEILWGTGLGPATFADNIQPKPGDLATPTELFVGGVKAAIQYHGRSGCCSGIDQIVFTVPDAAPLGCWVPVYVRTDGTAVSNFVTMAISADGGPCTEPANKLASALIQGGNIASYAAARFDVQHDAAVPTPRQAITDLLGAFQAREQQLPFNFNPMFSLPPAGTCTVYSVIGDLSSNDDAIIPGMTPPTGNGLDAGSIQISGTNGSKTAASSPYPGMFGARLAGAIPSLPLTNTSFLDPGSFSLTLGGGPDLGKATANFSVPSPFHWTNRDQIGAVTRSQGLPITWTGGDPKASTLIAGTGVDLPTNSTSLFVCVASPAATSFTVPPDVLANIPATRPRPIQSKGVVYVLQWNISGPVTMPASGLDFSSVVPAFISGKTVTFQ